MLCIISDISNQFLYPLSRKKYYQQALCFPEEKTSKLNVHRPRSVDEADLCSLGICFETNGFCIVHIWLQNKDLGNISFQLHCHCNCCSPGMPIPTHSCKLSLYPWTRNNQNDLGFAFCRTEFWFILSTASLELLLLK